MPPKQISKSKTLFSYFPRVVETEAICESTIDKSTIEKPTNKQSILSEDLSQLHENTIEVEVTNDSETEFPASASASASVSGSASAYASASAEESDSASDLGSPSASKKQKLEVPNCIEVFYEKTSSQLRKMIRCRICINNPSCVTINKSNRTPRIATNEGTRLQKGILKNHLESDCHHDALKAEKFKALRNSYEKEGIYFF